jgi:hypothetical protein
MSINMEEQFKKLQDIVLNQIDKFYFFAGANRYLGPVHPTSIITFSSNIIQVNALVLAEGVPSFYLPPRYASMVSDAVVVFLDNNFEFRAWDAAGKALYQLNLLVGDPKHAYDGTVDSAKIFFDENKWNLTVQYKDVPDKNAPTGN